MIKKHQELIDNAVEAAFVKTEATKDPADLEKAVGLLKSNAEIQKLLADSNKASAEIEKLLADRDKASAEIEKLRADRDKAVEDTKKVTVDASLAAKQMRLASLGAIFSPLVPIASLLTVVVTLFISGQQIRVSSEQAMQKFDDERIAREHVSWQTFQTTLDNAKTPDDLYSSTTFMARLRAFAASGRHDTELADIVKKLMIGISSASGFQDMWKLQVKSVNSNNFTYVIELARAKKQKFDEIQVSCLKTPIPADIVRNDEKWNYLGLCSPNYLDTHLQAVFSDQKSLEAFRALKLAVFNTSNILSFMSQEISAYVRENHNKSKPPRDLDLSGIILWYSSLEDVDLSKADLTQTNIGAIVLKGTILTAAKPTVSFSGSTWWDAETIDQKILPNLIVNSFPSDFLPSGYSITREKYVEHVLRLCTSKLSICSDGCIQYRQEPKPTAPQCQLSRD